MLAPNTVLQNRYRIVRQLGQGGMGTVYEAVDQRLKSLVAVKETVADSDSMRRAFEHEASLLANLRHPSLPKVTDHFIEGDGQFLVTEFIAGDDLAKLLEKRGRAFPPPEVLGWAEYLKQDITLIDKRNPGMQSIFSRPLSYMTSLSAAQKSLNSRISKLSGWSTEEQEALFSAMRPLVKPNINQQR